ncbi:MAG: hypothetical protein ABSC13_02700 [Dehalococcoidia bacterium]
MTLQLRERESSFIYVNDTTRPGLVCGAFHAISYHIGCPCRRSHWYLQTTPVEIYEVAP